MAYIIGMVDKEELAALNAAGWEDENPPASLLVPDLERDDNRLRMFWVDSDVFAIMSGPDWEPVNNPTRDYRQDYTVILLRPDYIADEYGKDVFHTFVEAISPADAAWRAQEAAAEADDAAGPADYHVLFTCRGKVANLEPGWE